MWWKYSVHMYVNGKNRPVETIPGMREKGINVGVVNSIIIYCKKFYKCHNVPSV
jgi:hypothetical protein